MEQNLRKEFAGYIVSNILGMIGMSCYILIDTFFIAQGMGSDGLTALNLALPAYNIVFGLGQMFGIGAATYYTIYQNQGKKERSQHPLTHSVIAIAVCSAICIVLGLFFSGTVASLMGATGKIHEMCSIYLKVLFFFAPMFMLNSLVQSYVKNDGAPKLVATAMIVGSIGNIILDYILIFPMNMGMLGAILATGVSPIISIFVQLPFFLKKKNHFHLVRCKWEHKMLKDICMAGSTIFISEMAVCVVTIVFNKILLALQGNTAVAAYGVIANISIVVIAIQNGISQGVQPLVSQYYGRGEERTIRKLIRYAVVTVLVISVISYVALVFKADGVTAIFNSENDVLLQSIATKGIKIYFAGSLFSGLNIVIASILAAMNRGKDASVISMLRGLILIIPFAFLLSYVWKIDGLWASFFVCEAIVAIVSVRAIYRAK